MQNLRGKLNSSELKEVKILEYSRKVVFLLIIYMLSLQRIRLSISFNICKFKMANTNI